MNHDPRWPRLLRCDVPEVGELKVTKLGNEGVTDIPMHVVDGCLMNREPFTLAVGETLYLLETPRAEAE